VHLIQALVDIKETRLATSDVKGFKPLSLCESLSFVEERKATLSTSKEVKECKQERQGDLLYLGLLEKTKSKIEHDCRLR
jgi:hypothetical protein